MANLDRYLNLKAQRNKIYISYVLYFLERRDDYES